MLHKYGMEWSPVLGPSHGAWLESQEHDPSQNAWSRGEECKRAIATGQELTPGQNAWSRGKEGKHAMATGQELTPGQNAWSRGEEGNHAMATGQELTPGRMHGHVVRKATMPWLLVKN